MGRECEISLLKTHLWCLENKKKYKKSFVSIILSKVLKANVQNRRLSADPLGRYEKLDCNPNLIDYDG